MRNSDKSPFPACNRARSFYKFFLTNFFTLFLSYAGLTQVPEPIKTVPTPTAWSFAQYGKVEVSHFTGLPNIQVPLAQTTYKANQIAMNLTYNASGFRPDMHAGTVGTGWSLNYGGVITRQVNGLPDEFYYYMDNVCDCFPEEHNDNYGTYNLGFIRQYKDPAFTLYELSKATNCFLNTNTSGGGTSANWVKYPYPVPYKGHWWNSICYYTSRYFNQNFIPAYHPGNDLVYTGTEDLQSDEYTFNVMGHSGKFYFQGPNSITVVSDKKYTVELLGADIDVPSTLLQPNSDPNAGATCASWMLGYSPWKAYNKYPKTIVGFRLLAEDGTIFTFGNRYYDHSAIDYSIAENYAPSQAGHGQQQVSDFWVANAWYLTAITFPDGKRLFYEYERGEYTRTLFNSEFAFEIRQNNPSCGVANANYQLPGQLTQSRIASPVYLARVYSDLLDIRFNYSNTNESNNLTSNAVQNFKWKKIDSILIKDYEGQSAVLKFSYYPLSSYSQRLFLQSVEKFDHASKSSKEKWSFEYDNTLTLPNYNIGHNDHWGFWNGINSISVIGKTNTQLDILRSPALSNAQAGILKKVIYPTGGYTEYTYELNTYSKKVKTNRHLGVDEVGANKAAGGLRIKSIKSADAITGTFITRDYFYVTGYTAGMSDVQIAGLPSSGVLNQSGYVYHWQDLIVNMYNYPSCVQNLKMTLSSNQPLNSTFDDYHVGYTTVVERLKDNSYTIFTYSNHDNGFLDDDAIARINPFTTPYNQCSSRKMERGKILEEAVYNNNGLRLQKTTTSYSRIGIDASADPNTHITRFSLQILSATNQIGFDNLPNAPMNYLFADRFKEYTYRFLPTKVTVERREENSPIPLVMEKTIQYSNPNHGQPTSMLTKNSDGSEEREIMKYTLDYPSIPVFNQIPKTTVIERIYTRRAKPEDEEMVTGAILHEYATPSYIGAVIKNIYQLAIQSPIPLSSMTNTVPVTTDLTQIMGWTKDARYVSEVTFKRYEPYDNPIEYHTKAGTKTYVFMGFGGLKQLGKVSSGSSVSYYNPAYTSFEQLTVRSAPDSYWTTTIIPENTTWILTGNRSTEYALTGKSSFNGRALYNGTFYEGNIYVAVRSNGNVPFLEQYNTTTGQYTPLSSTPTVISDREGWKVYHFVFAYSGLQLAVNSNGNYMDELRVISRSFPEQNPSVQTYEYTDGLLTKSLDYAYRRISYEYDSFGRLLRVRDDDNLIIKEFDYQYQAVLPENP